MIHGATQNGLRFIQNEPRGASVSGGSDDEQQRIRDSSTGPGLNEEMLSDISFDLQRRSPELLDYQASLIPQELFDMFVVDVEGGQEVEGSSERRGRSAEQSEDGMNHR